MSWPGAILRYFGLTRGAADVEQSGKDPGAGARRRAGDRARAGPGGAAISTEDYLRTKREKLGHLPD